jgi:hypothetical protein
MGGATQRFGGENESAYFYPQVAGAIYWNEVIGLMQRGFVS